MAFLANHAGFATQEGTDEAPTDYTPLVGKAHIEQGVGPSSQLIQQRSRFPYVQPSQLVAYLPMTTQDVDTLMQAPTDYTPFVGEAHIGQGVGPSIQLNQQNRSFPYVQPSQLVADTLLQESSHPYSNSHTNNYPFLAESNSRTDTTVAPLCPSATPYISSATEAMDAYAAPTPPPALPVAQGASVLENVADSAELRGTRRTEEEWADQRSKIRRLYMDQNMTLPSTMKVMKEKHGFCATYATAVSSLCKTTTNSLSFRQKRYKEKIKAWGFEKNLTRRQSKYISRIALRRLDQGKKTEFHLKGSVIPQDKVDRHLAKPNIRGSPTGSTLHRI